MLTWCPGLFPTAILSTPQDKKDFIDMRVKRLLKAGVISALACMVKADSSILTNQTKELLARCGCLGAGLGSEGPWRQEAGQGGGDGRGVTEGLSHGGA